MFYSVCVRYASATLENDSLLLSHTKKTAAARHLERDVLRGVRGRRCGGRSITQFHRGRTAAPDATPPPPGRALLLQSSARPKTSEGNEPRPENVSRRRKLEHHQAWQDGEAKRHGGTAKGGPPLDHLSQRAASVQPACSHRGRPLSP